jgi:hypothetical protein
MISLTELSLAGHEFTWTSNQFLPDARRNIEYYNDYFALAPVNQLGEVVSQSMIP